MGHARPLQSVRTSPAGGSLMGWVTRRLLLIRWAPCGTCACSGRRGAFRKTDSQRATACDASLTQSQVAASEQMDSCRMQPSLRRASSALVCERRIVMARG